MPAILESSDLVGAYLGGESRAFDRLFERYSTRLLNFINRIIGDRERAEDLVQEAFIRVHRHLPRFDRSKQFSTWIYTIASNLAKNELRNRSRNPLGLSESVEPAGDEDRPHLQLEDKGSRPDELYRQRYLAEAVHWSVERLSPRHREVFVLRELEGKSYEEIAASTGTNVGTVKSRLNRARRSFAAEIEPYLD
jgi:RNA polymerase sigma-70 factor, ECF subfamily